jgi:hypothetical protein
MRIKTIGLLVAFAALAAPLPALAQSCSALWYERNQIYARNGYCFQTARAISVFGRGCFPPYGQLSGYDRSRVNEIQRMERAYGC